MGSNPGYLLKSFLRYWNWCLSPSNRYRQQIMLHPSSWQYPLISYLDPKQQRNNKTSICMHGRAKKTLKRCIGARALARARATQRADRDRLLKGVLGSELELPSCKATNLPPSVFWPEGVRKHKITTVKVSAKYAYLLRRKKIRQMTAGS